MVTGGNRGTAICEYMYNCDGRSLIEISVMTFYTVINDKDKIVKQIFSCLHWHIGGLVGCKI